MADEAHFCEGDFSGKILEKILKWAFPKDVGGYLIHRS
jgi:hypothetical protein